MAATRITRLTSTDRVTSHLTDRNLRGRFFRGQSNADWGLDTGLHRTFLHLASGSLNESGLENSIIGSFKREFGAHSRMRPSEDDLLGWLSLMQHYRAPTRLLDWTTSPLVALYFAVRDLDPDIDGAVWVLNPNILAAIHGGPRQWRPWDHIGLWRLNTAGTAGPGSPEFQRFEDLQNHRIRLAVREESRWPLPLVPNWVDQRMLAQQSAFTLAGRLDFPLERLSYRREWRIKEFPEPLRQQLSNTKTDDFLTKVEFSGNLKRDLLMYLHFAGVTPSSLFPGLDGLGNAVSQLPFKVVPTADVLTSDKLGVPLFNLE